jgi:DNA-binding NarL/FixJ family response regulator
VGPSTQPARRPRVLLADDDVGIQTAITRLLSVSCDVVGVATESAALLELAVRLRPDVVLLDFSLRGGLSGIDVIRRLTATAPDVRVVAFTAINDEDVRTTALEAGAAAFVWKLQAGTTLLTTIQEVADLTSRSDG